MMKTAREPAKNELAQNADPWAGFNAFFPLMAWDDVEDEATIQKMTECGINTIAFVPPRLLDACARHGVKAIVIVERVTPNWDQPFNAQQANKVLPELIENYNNHPAVYGYHLKDETDSGQFAALGESSRLVNQLAPGKWPYINLFPKLNEDYVDRYLQQFVDTCKPPVLSYDHYAI